MDAEQPSTATRFDRLVRQLVCWWFGCDPDYRPQPNTSAIPCKRCGAFDVTYSDCVGDTRHNRMKQRIVYWCWTRWLGDRSHENPDIPF